MKRGYMTVGKNINQIIKKIGEQSSDRKWLKKYDGLYVYQIIELSTDTVVRVGFSENFYDRRYSHYSRGGKSTLLDWCRTNNKDITDYMILVMDFRDYTEYLDKSDVKLVEQAISHYNQETIFNTDYPKEFNAHQLERLEYIHGIVKYDFVPYEDLKIQYDTEHKLKKSNKKVLRSANQELERN